MQRRSVIPPPGTVMDKKTLMGIAQKAADELGLDCRAHNASQVPEDANTWCVLFTAGYGQARVKLWPGYTDELIKDEIAKQLRRREKTK